MPIEVARVNILSLTFCSPAPRDPQTAAQWGSGSQTQEASQPPPSYVQSIISACVCMCVCVKKKSGRKNNESQETFGGEGGGEEGRWKGYMKGRAKEQC